VKLPVPETGNRAFERVLKEIELEEVVGRAQITKFVAPRLRTSDVDVLSGVLHPPGKLQHRDLLAVRTLFEHPDFIVRTIVSNALFDTEEARVFQFQNQTSNGRFVYGIFVTDGCLNLVDFCVDASRQDKRRSVLKPLIRAVCTPESLQGRLH
jgi:hypothetical protein